MSTFCESYRTFASLSHFASLFRCMLIIIEGSKAEVEMVEMIEEMSNLQLINSLYLLHHVHTSSQIKFSQPKRSALQGTQHAFQRSTSQKSHPRRTNPSKIAMLNKRLDNPRVWSLVVS